MLFRKYVNIATASRQSSRYHRCVNNFLKFSLSGLLSGDALRRNKVRERERFSCKYLQKKIIIIIKRIHKQSTPAT